MLYTPVTDKNEQIPTRLWTPSYMDSYFTRSRSEGRTIFADPSVTPVSSGMKGEIVEGLEYTYSDRLVRDIGRETLQKIQDAVIEEGLEDRTAAFIEKVLQQAFGEEDLWIGHIKAGVNLESGEDYRMYGHRPAA